MNTKLKGDYTLGGGWGDHIDLAYPREFHLLDLNKDIVKLYGHTPYRIKVGDTVLGDFQKSWILFKVKKIEYMRDPTDMFFADTVVIKQQLKSSDTVIIVGTQQEKPVNIFSWIFEKIFGKDMRNNG